MARVSYDGKSYFLDGERIWLVCGEMHYFRVPREYWRDRMKKAKENGINCISTYMAWNLHEPSPGTYDFTGGLDVEAYIRTAQEEGLYLILRPGPYICSEVDFGGLPAYLTEIKGPYRTWNPEYAKRYEAYYKEILPTLSRLDVEHGGNILLIQNENEHIMPDLEGRREYFQDLSRIFRECGFLIPIVHCNRMFEGTTDGVIECVNTWDDPLADIDSVRKVQPNAPQLITELWCGGCDAWRHDFIRRSPWEAWQRTLAITLYGGQYTYYMWHGGTNFGFLGGKFQYEEDYHIITSYDLDAPLSEGGVRGEKYYVTGLSDKFAQSFGKQLCQMNRECHRAGNETKLKIWDEKNCFDVRVDFSQKGMAGIQFKANTMNWKGHTLSFADLFPLWQDEENLYLYGETGKSVSLIADGESHDFQIADEAYTLQWSDGTIHVLSVEEAMVQTVIDGKLKKGCREQENERTFILPNWELSGREAPEEKEWIPLEKPAGAEALGQYYGYLWYRLTIPSEKEERKKLSFFQSGDRCTVYQDGKVCGIWGPGETDGFSGVTVCLHPGENQLYVLCDNLGRLTHSYKIGEKKGIYGAPGYGEKVSYTLVREGSVIPCDPPSMIDWSPEEKHRFCREIEYTFHYSGEGKIHIQMEMECSLEIRVNGKIISLEQNPGIGYADVDLSEKDLCLGENSLVLRLFSSRGQEAIKKMELTLVRSIPRLSISWSRWEHHPETGENTQKYPGWYTLRLKDMKWEGPAFLAFPDGNKGQLYVNGVSVGRIWSGKPQRRYYIPEYLLNGDVEMRYFSEGGMSPDGCVLCSRQEFQGGDDQTETLDVI